MAKSPKVRPCVKNTSALTLLFYIHYVVYTHFDKCVFYLAVFQQQDSLNQRVFGDKYLPVNQEDAVTNTVSQQLFGQTYPQRYVPNIAPQPQNPRPDEQLWQESIDHLYQEEGHPDHIYLDTKGYKTIGVGTNVDDWNTFNAVNWQINGRPASEAEKRQAFDIFENLKRQKSYGQKKDAVQFENYSSLQISDTESRRLLDSRLLNNWLDLYKEVPNFLSMPSQLQKVLLDIKYNTGNVKQEKWPKLHQAIAEKNLPEIRKNIHRKDVAESRNQWAEQQIDAIKNW